MYVQSMICLGYALNACLHVHVHVVVCLYRTVMWSACF